VVGDVVGHTTLSGMRVQVRSGQAGLGLAHPRGMCLVLSRPLPMRRGMDGRGSDSGWRGCMSSPAVASNTVAVVAHPLGYLGSVGRATGTPGVVVVVVVVPWLDLENSSW
jgi:hypothetical protein